MSVIGTWRVVVMKSSRSWRVLSTKRRPLVGAELGPPDADGVGEARKATMLPLVDEQDIFFRGYFFLMVRST